MQLCVWCRVLNNLTRKSYIAKTYPRLPSFSTFQPRLQFGWHPQKPHPTWMVPVHRYSRLDQFLSLALLCLSSTLQGADTTGLFLLPRCCEISSLSTLAFGTAAETPSFNMGPCARAVAAESCPSLWHLSTSPNKRLGLLLCMTPAFDTLPFDSDLTVSLQHD